MISLVWIFLWFSTLQISTAKTGPTTPRQSDFVKCRLSDELKEQFVDFHNKFRGEVQPSAADMEYMEWNDDIGNLAQMWTDKCEWMHGFTRFGDWLSNEIFRSKSVGQNLAREWGKWIDREAGPEDSVRRWFIEKDYYSFGKFAYPMPSSMCSKAPCGHYTQVVWAKSKQVGCAFKWCDKDFDMPHPWIPGETVVTCDYFPGGNFVGQLPYTPGPPCTKCASGQGWCYKNLCRECKNFSPKCGTTYTKNMCLTKKDLMEKNCPQMCNLCRCPLKCKNGGAVDPKTCTCTCYGKWKGGDCSERICDQGWYGENCEKRCSDKVGTDNCKWRVQNGHPCTRSYMKVDCIKTCVCDRMPKPKPKPTAPLRTTPKVTARPVPTTSTPVTGKECKDKRSTKECETWAKGGVCKSEKWRTWMRKNCMKSCGVCIAAVDGNWAAWSKWTTCSKTCDGGQMTRSRACTNPAPQNGGRTCQGSSSESANCNSQQCPPPVTARPAPTTSTPGEECKDKRTKDCETWAKGGVCKSEKWRTWMRENCMKSCGVCTCQDVSANAASCKRWATNGECKKNAPWMEANCPRSCLVCDCYNKRTKCGEWAKSGYCENKFAAWMGQNCKKSCNKC